MTAVVEGATSHFFDLPGLRMHVMLAGPEDGEPVLLLHGFPEFWFSWRHQITALAAAGYRVIAPDQRGYNLTEKQGPYDAKTLTNDLIHLLDAMDIIQAHVVGHDWGSVLAWVFCSEHGDRVLKHVNLNGPHPNAYMKACIRHPSQLLKSWYVMAFQLPWLPERMLRSRDWRFLSSAMRPIPKENMPDDGVAAYKEAHSHPGALSAMIGWYRAAPRQALGTLLSGKRYTVSTQTLVIWGEADPYLSKHCNDALPAYVDELQVAYLPGVSHWVQVHAPDRVSELILAFFRG